MCPAGEAAESGGESTEPGTLEVELWLCYWFTVWFVGQVT